MASSRARRRIVTASTATLLTGVWLIASRGLPARVALMFEAGLPPNPWFVPGSAGILYVILPVTILVGIVAWMLPGLLLTASWRRDLDFAPWVMHGFLVSLLSQWGLGALATRISTGPVSDTAFLVAWLALMLFGLIAYVRREARGCTLEGDETPRTGRRLLLSAGLVLAGVLLLLPKIFWQDLGPDAFEALELGRSLAWFALPRVPTEASILGLGAGMVPQAAPIRWFILLYGPIEAAARLPLLLSLTPILAGLIGLIEVRAPRRLGRIEEVGVALGVAMVTMAVGLHATYSPYAVDLASPTAIEFVAVVLVLGAILAFWRDEALTFLALSGVALLARPTAAVIILLAGLGTMVLEPGRRSRTLRLLVGVLGVWVLLYLAYERLFVLRASLDTAEYTAGGIIDRFHFLTFTDWRRLIWVAAPAGFIPFLSLFRLRKLDDVGRSAAVATLLSFGVVAVPAFVALHHFVPMMLLPIAVFWRLQVHERSGSARLLGAYALLSVLAVGLALPPHLGVSRGFRDIGRQTDNRIAGFGGEDYPSHRAAVLAASASLGTLFLADWAVPDAAEELVGGPQILYYADRRERVEPNTDILFLVQSSGDPAPEGALRVSDVGGASAFVLDSLAWQSIRFTPPPGVSLSRLYRVPRATFRQYIGEPAGNYDTSLSNWPVVWRLFNR
jgi:hypothetical protein